jgi:multiple sugar transport system permease protein
MAMTTPWVVGVVVLTAFPMGYSLFLSLTEYSSLQPPEYVGLENYRTILGGDEKFLAALRVTGLFTLLSTPLGVALSLGLAMLLSMNIRAVSVWRVIYYIPSILPPLATALLWSWLLDPEKGLINRILIGIGLVDDQTTILWFNDPDGTWVIAGFVLMSLQGAAGNNMLIFLAGVKSLPTSPYESAMIDGASWAQRFWHISLPLLSPIILYQTVMGIIGGLQVFTQPMFIRTPGDTGLFYAVHIFREGWSHLRMGYAYALAWVLFLIILAMTWLVLRVSRSIVYYERDSA